MRIPILSLTLALALAPHALAEDLTVTIKNVEMSGSAPKGKLYLCVYPSSVATNSEFPSCEIAGIQKLVVTQVAGGKGTYKVSGLGAGEYALSSFQDTDGDAKLNLEVVGKLARLFDYDECPLERVGTYRPANSRPKFQDISFKVPAVSELTIELKDFTGFPAYCSAP